MSVQCFDLRIVAQVKELLEGPDDPEPAGPRPYLLSDEDRETFYRSMKLIKQAHATMELWIQAHLDGAFSDPDEPSPKRADMTFGDEGPIATAVGLLSHEMKELDGFAWSWHCAIACCIQDEGVDWQKANAAARRFMKLAFDVEGYDPT